MTFLAAFSFLHWLHVVSAVRASLQRLPLRALANYAVLTASGGALLTGALGVRLGAQRIGGANEAVWCFLLLGLGSVLISCAGLARAFEPSHQSDPLGWRVGVRLVSLLAGLYLLGALADHAWFARHGVVVVADPAVLGVTDIACNGVVLAQVRERGPSTYRCAPNNAWGIASNVPFVPWPTYVTGTSRQLGQRIAAVKGEAAKP